jgi:glycosyltransferase involved in cell wall biosynthesis
MSVGTAVVAARQPAVEEIAAGHALLVPPGDADAWAVALSALPSAPPAARPHARSFTWDAAAASLLAVLADVRG